MPVTLGDLTLNHTAPVARSRGLLAVSLAMSLLMVAGCGARWTDDQRATVLARQRADGTATAEASGVTGRDGPAGGPDDTVRGGRTSTGGGAVADPAGAASGGTAGGPGERTSAAGGRAPCEAASDAPGVTDSEITVAEISALTGPKPGLAASSAAAARAYVAYRNSTGGVCGRKIVLREADDNTDAARYRTLVAELEPKVFGIAGGFTVGDVGGKDTVRAKRLPVVNGPSTQDVADLPTVFDIFPRYQDPHGVIGKYKWLKANGAATVAIAYLGVDASRYEARLQQGLMEAAGIKVVSVNELPLATLSYDSAARKVANSKADYLWFIADVNGEASMARAMQDTGYKVKFAEYYNFPYGTNYTDLAGSAAEGTVAFLRSLPNEEAASNPQMSAFVQWMGRIAPSADLDPFAVDSWVSAKLFFDTLQGLPGPISREAFIAKLTATPTYDAGGMFGPIRIGPEYTNGCVIGMRYQGGKWRRLVPSSGFLC